MTRATRIPSVLPCPWNIPCRLRSEVARMTEICAPLVLDHVLDPDHDAMSHSAVFEGVGGNLFCVHCASIRYNDAPAIRRLALLDGIRTILVHGVPPSLRAGGVDACLPMLLRGIDSSDAGVVQAATDIMLALKDELANPLGHLSSLVSSTVSLGLPRASAHLFLIGQLLTNASRDRGLATALGSACFGRCDGPEKGRCPGLSMSDGGSRGGLTGTAVEGGALEGFGSFLAAHALSASCPDNVKSDVLYVAMELLDCCTVAGSAIARQGLSLLPPPGGDPFASIMLAVPRLLARRSSCDEPLQLHSVAYLATSTTYCRLRTEMGVPGWSSNAIGVSEVLIALFDGARDFASRDVAAVGGSSAQSSPGGLCSTLKALLMSSSYRVRSATARLIASLCADDGSLEAPTVVHSNSFAVSGGGSGGGGGNGTGRYFREIMIAACATDFLFEAIKSEREGTPRHYLEALEGFALSPVEFFHAGNFSMKFCAPVLLGASRDGASCRGSETLANKDDAAAVISMSSRLLLQALVTAPSAEGVVEELLATVAVSTSTQLGALSKIRAIAFAADVLGLVASGEISLMKDRGKFVNAVGVLLDHLVEDLACAACMDPQQQQQQQQQRQGRVQDPVEAAFSSLGSESADREPAGYPDHGDFILQCARVFESLLHTAEDWMPSFVGGPSFRGAGIGCRKEQAAAAAEAEGVALADLVFTAYERTLSHQCNLIARSENLAHDIAFLSCLGAAVDATSSVIFQSRRREEAATAAARSSGSGTGASFSQFIHVRPSFIGTQELESPVDADHGGSDSGGLLASGGVGSAVSCLETILGVAVDADVVSWMLTLFWRCGVPDGGTSYGSLKDGADPCGATTRELLVEVLQSFLYAQGWANGLCRLRADRPSHKKGGWSCGDVGEVSRFGETVRVLLQSWTASGVSGRGEEFPTPFDQHALSLLGTNVDNGLLCKLVALLVSLSPSFLGVLHPHLRCRTDSAVTLLRHVNTVPEAVFCLNLLSHIVLAVYSQTGEGFGGRRRRLPDLSEAVKDLLARFPVAEVALSLIPLSSAALWFCLAAGCEAFVADWLVAAPSAQIKRALTALGAFRGWPKQAADHDDAVGFARDDEQQLVAERFGREALIGVLESALTRWRAEVDSDLQHHAQSDAVVYRLGCVLLMSPDMFCSLAFEVDFQGNGDLDREQGDRQQFADTLGSLVSETLEGLAAALLPVVARRGNRSNDHYRASKLAWACQVSQLASAFLRARYSQGCYTPAGDGMVSNRAPLPRRDPPEVALARACGGLLEGVLSPRRGQDLSDDADNTHRVLLSVLNLLNALLVLLGGDSGLPHETKQGLELALEESHAALSGVLAPSAEVTERLTGWLDHAPDTLAAFLQICALWNMTESKSDGFGDKQGNSHLDVPFQVLMEVLSCGGSGSFVVASGQAGSSKCNSSSNNTNTNVSTGTKAPSPTRRRAVRRSMLRVLAVRCVESSVETRSFSSPEVLALQLALQGIACGSSAALASAGLGALQALWDAYVGSMPSADLVGQSWNPFMVECSLENALGSLLRDAEGGADLLRFGNNPEELSVGAPVLVSTIGRLLRWSAGKACPRLSHSKAPNGGFSGVEVLSATAAVSLYQCAALLAADLRMALGGGTGQRGDLQQTDQMIECDGGSSSSSSSMKDYRREGIDIDRERFHLADALAQLLHVVKRIEPLPVGGLPVGEGARRELADALLLLSPALLSFGETRSRLERVPMPLSTGAYHDSGATSGTTNSYDGVFFVTHDTWRSISSASEAMSLAELAGEVERLVERLSGRPVVWASTEAGQDGQLPGEASVSLDFA